MLAVDPNNRPSASELLRDPIFTGNFNEDKIVVSPREIEREAS